MEKKNVELESRREFFKKAAKGVLPILGAIMLSNVSGVMKASESSPMGCSSDNCSYTCNTSCHKSCYSGCQGTCKTTCQGGCRGGYTNMK